MVGARLCSVTRQCGGACPLARAPRFSACTREDHTTADAAKHAQGSQAARPVYTATRASICAGVHASATPNQQQGARSCTQLGARSRVVGQNLRQDVRPGDARQAAHQPAGGELRPALGRLQRVARDAAAGQRLDAHNLRLLEGHGAVDGQARGQDQHQAGGRQGAGDLGSLSRAQRAQLDCGAGGRASATSVHVWFTLDALWLRDAFGAKRTARARTEGAGHEEAVRQANLHAAQQRRHAGAVRGQVGEEVRHLGVGTRR